MGATAHTEAFDEPRLVEAAKRRDQRAASALYHHYHPRVFRQAYMFVRDHDVASELAQEAFATALARIDDFDPARAAFGTWLYGILANLSRNHWRRQTSKQRLLDRVKQALGWSAQAEPSPEHSLEAREQGDALHAAIQRLKPAHREALILVDLEELSCEQAGAILGVSPGNVRVRAHRGRAQIARELTKTRTKGAA